MHLARVAQVPLHEFQRPIGVVRSGIVRVAFTEALVVVQELHMPPRRLVTGNLRECVGGIEQVVR
jgi:hypothetical protein|eukprot:COSAG01_NODE_5045_length_4528_cov_2.181079_7_plen_65_part_00